MAPFWWRWTWQSALAAFAGAAVGAIVHRWHFELYLVLWSAGAAFPANPRSFGIAATFILAAAGMAIVQHRLLRRFARCRHWLLATLLGAFGATFLWFALAGQSLPVRSMLAGLTMGALQWFALRSLQGTGWWLPTTILAAVAAQVAAIVTALVSESVLHDLVEERALRSMTVNAAWSLGVTVGLALFALSTGCMLQRLLRRNGLLPPSTDLSIASPSRVG
jgi:MFS family permease